MADWFAGVTYSFAPASVISSAEMNQNFTDIKNAINAAMPTGGIIIWSGAIADIPSEWALCNGANGTSDMRDKFVIGAGSSYAVDATGGEATHTLTEAELPVISLNGKMTDPGHYHTVYHKADDQDGSGSNGSTSGTSNTSTNTTGITFANIGSGNAHNNLPPYFAKAFIQKLA